MRVARQDRLVVFKLGPADVGFVVIVDEGNPTLSWPPMAAAALCPRSAHCQPHFRLPIRVTAGVERIGQNAQNRMVARHLPLYAAFTNALLNRGKRQSVRVEPEQDLTSAAELVKLTENRFDRGANATVGIAFDGPGGSPNEADRQAEV
jgi:hypothetical protein